VGVFVEKYLSQLTALCVSISFKVYERRGMYKDLMAILRYCPNEVDRIGSTWLKIT